MPSKRNCTLLTPTLSEALACSVIVPETVAPFVGEVTATVGGVVSEAPTVKVSPLLAMPETLTTTLPVVAPVGTGATTLDALQLVGVAVTPLNVTELVPWVAPKFDPLILTEVPTLPEVGLKLEIIGAVPVVTVKVAPLLAVPPTVTTTFPLVAPLGTGATMLVELQLAGFAATPLNCTVLLDCAEPKFVPVMVTA